MLASYIIDPSRTIDDVNSVVSNYNQNFVQDDISIYGKGKKRHVPEDTILNKHIASITEAIYACKREMVELESHQQIDLLLNLELPLARILSEMEETGIYTDINDLRQMQSEIQGKLDLLISNIHEAVGKNLTLTLLNN